MGGSNVSSFVFLIAAAAMFYLLVIRPQQKRQKAQAEMLNAVKPGVEIVTIGGIFGTIVEIDDDRVRIRVADGSELEIARRAIGSVVPVADVAEATDEDDELPAPPASEEGEVEDDSATDSQG